MIDKHEHPIEWAVMYLWLTEAREHLDKLLQYVDSDEFDEVPFAIDLAHIYAHLNEVWNGRNKIGEWSDEEFEAFRQYPTDLEPGGFLPTKEK